MEELYSETYLKAQPPFKRVLIRNSLIILAVFIIIFGVLAMLIMKTPTVFLIMLLVAGIIIFLAPKNKIAYEYIFVDGQIDFDRIIGGEKRKTMKRVDMEKMEIIAPATSHFLDSYGKLPVIDFSSGYAKEKDYIAVCNGEKGLEKIRFTPDEKMLHMMKLKSRSKVKDE